MMDVQLAIVMMILAATLGSIGLALWKKTRQPDDSCATNCGCGGPSRSVQQKVNARRP